MKFKIDFDDNKNIFVITTEDVFNINDFELLASQLLGDPNWSPGANCIFDYRKTDFIKVGLKDLVKSKSIHSSNNQLIGDGKSAIVMKDQANYGIGQMYERMTESSVRTSFGIFTDINEANLWIAGE